MLVCFVTVSLIIWMVCLFTFAQTFYLYKYFNDIYLHCNWHDGRGILFILCIRYVQIQSRVPGEMQNSTSRLSEERHQRFSRKLHYID